MNKFQPPVQVLDQRAAAFDPVAVVAIQDAINLTHLGAVNVAADNALVATALGLLRNRHLKICHVIQGRLDPVLEVRR